MAYSYVLFISYIYIKYCKAVFTLLSAVLNGLQIGTERENLRLNLQGQQTYGAGGWLRELKEGLLILFVRYNDLYAFTISRL